MEEQTLDVHVPSVAEALAKLLTENNFTDEAEKIRDSFTPKALTDYCDAFFQSRVGPRVDLSNFQRARNFLRLRTEDKLIEQMKAILDAHDISLEYFKTKVINSLGRMPGVGSEIIKGVPQFLNPELSSASFLELISQIINDHAQDDESKPALEDAVRQLAERFKPELLIVEEKKDGEAAAEPSLFDRIMRKFIKRKLTDEEEFERLKAIELESSAHFDWPPAKLEPQVVVKATMDIIYGDNVQVELPPARPQFVEPPKETSIEEIPAAPILDRVFSVFRRKKAEEKEVVAVAAEEAVVVASPEPDVIVTNTNNGGPSLFSRLTTTFTTTVTSAVEASFESVKSFVAPKPSIRFPADDETFNLSEKRTAKRELRERCEKLNDEIRVGSDFLASAIEQHSRYLDAHVLHKLKVLSRDITIGQENDIKQEIIDQLSFYETARDDNIKVGKDDAVKKAAVRWWNVGFLKYLPILSYFYEKLKERTTDYFESALACEQIKMELATGAKDSFNSNAEKYRTHFGEYIGERFQTFFERNEERNRAGDALAPLEAQWKEEYGETLRYGYKQKPEIELTLESELGDSDSARVQAEQYWDDLAADAPPPPTSAPSLRIN